jgi:hypothetical protein
MVVNVSVAHTGVSSVSQQHSVTINRYINPRLNGWLLYWHVDYPCLCLLARKEDKENTKNDS